MNQSAEQQFIVHDPSAPVFRAQTKQCRMRFGVAGTLLICGAILGGFFAQGFTTGLIALLSGGVGVLALCRAAQPYRKL